MQITVIIKPTLDCNLSCRYCYFDGMRTHEKMSLKTLENLFMHLRGYEEIKIIWHGGEPMLMGIDFYKQAIRLQEDLKVKNMFQSNLTLLNDAWIDFFRQENITPSTSLDGVKEVHDTGRSGSFDRVVGAIQKLRSQGIKTSAVVVHNDYSLPYLYDNFRLWSGMGMNVKINVQSCSGGNKNAINTAAKSYEFALRYYHDMWLGMDDRTKIRIDPTCDFYESIRTGCGVRGCTFGDNCVGKFPAILPSGDVVHCGRFVGSGFAELGNVNDPRFSFGDDNPLIVELRDLNEKRVSECSGCEYFKMCHAGCFYHGWVSRNNGGDGRDFLCSAYKELFRHVQVRYRQMGGS